MQYSKIFILSKALFFIIFFLTIVCKGQENIDSINSELQKNNLSQEKQIELHILLANEYTYSNTLKAKSILDEQLQNPKILNYPKLHVEVLLNLGLTESLTANRKESISLYLEAINIAEEQNLQKQLVKAYSYMAVVSMDFQLYDQALNYLKRSIQQIHVNRIESDRLGEIYTNTGVCFQKSYREDSAIYYYQKALNYYRSVDNQEDLAVSLDNIGQLYESAGFPNKSRDLFKEAERINRKYQNNYHLVGNLNNLALYYKSILLYDSALLFFQEVDSICIANGLEKDRAINFYNKANVFYALKEYNEALFNYDSSLVICDEIQLEYGIMLISSHKARVLVVQGKDKEAEDLWEEASLISEENDFLSFPSQLEGLKAGAYELAEKYEKALDARNRKITLEEKAKKDNHERLVSNLIKYYEVDIKNREIVHQKSKLHQKNILLYIISTAFFIILILILILYKKMKAISIKNAVLIQQLNNNLRIIPKRISLVEKEPPSQNDIIYDKFISFLEDESPYLDHQISRAKLASYIGTNEKYLSQALKEKTNLSLTEILNRRRIYQAIKMLIEDSYENINAIAASSGFTSERTFYRVFKKITGLTPSEFKRIPIDKKSHLLNQFEI